ncbi:metal cation symporter ZIP14 isoform X4 [Hydra vulgaris]|uniref:Metal cation symporter ZIP14 isoform X4 n=1 Tax=Hydra vulgaris TaxID=6087 RepID=A0ABM4CVD9_HYDVU
MWLKFLLCFFAVVYTIEDVNNSFINEAFERTALLDSLKRVSSKEDIQIIMSELHFRNCSKNQSYISCNLCFTSDDLLSLFSISSQNNFSSHESLMIYSGILYLLTAKNIGVECKTYLNISSVYKEFFMKYDFSIINNRVVDKILSDVNVTLGNYLNGSQCFGSEDIIKAANISLENINEHGLQLVSVFIVQNLLNNFCISISNKDTVLLPPESYFIEKIFEKYGNETKMQKENFVNLLKKLNIGFSSAPNEVAKRKKRSVSKDNLLRKRRNVDQAFDKCYAARDLFEIFNVVDNSTIDYDKFKDICSAIVQQIDSGYCSPIPEPEPVSEKNNGGWKPWIATIVGVTVVNLFSFLGLICSPLNNKWWFPSFLLFIISMGVGVLSGDGILHMLPEMLDLHDDHHGKFSADSKLWKFCLILFGIYIFFAFEIIMQACGTGHSHSHGGGSTNNDSQRTRNGELETSTSETECGEELTQSDYTLPNLKYCNNSAVSLSHKESSNSSVRSSTDKISKNVSEVSLTHNEESGVAFKLSKKSLPIKEFKSIVWMIFVGDGIHNFMDGVALGAAFSDPLGITGGISTSIAILLHEIPHELSDFAILITAGLSIKQALAMHFISSITAYGGGFLGVSLGTDWNAAPWIFSITAGLFLYVSLVDMLPQILHNELFKSRPLSTAILALIGMLFGFGIMFCLAAFEESILEGL